MGAPIFERLHRRPRHVPAHQFVLAHRSKGTLDADQSLALEELRRIMLSLKEG